MAQEYLIDTNVIIDFSENRLPREARLLVAQIIDSGPKLSVINKIELLGFSNVTDELAELVEASTIIDLTDSIINKTIEIRKGKKIKLPDAIIAASCIDHDLRLLTRNTSDFEHIDGLFV